MIQLEEELDYWKKKFDETYQLNIYLKTQQP